MFIDGEDGKKVAEEAKTWMGVPHVNGAMDKEYGVDCALLSYAVARDAGVIDDHPEWLPKDYSADWYLHRNDNRMIDTIEKFCDEVTDGLILPGDILTYRYGRAPSHVGIVIDDRAAVHADANIGEVICYYYEDELKDRLYKVYRIRKE